MRHLKETKRGRSSLRGDSMWTGTVGSKAGAVLGSAVLACLGTLLVIRASPALAEQQPAATAIETPADELLTEDAIQARLTELETEIGQSQERVEGLQANSPERAREAEVLARLGRVESTLKAELQVLHRLAPPETTPGKEEAAPASIFALNKIDQNLEAAKSEQQKLDKAVEASRDALAAAEEEYEKAERERREARDAAEKEEGGANPLERQHALQLRRLESRAALETVRLRELELQAAREVLEAHRLRFNDLRLQLARIEEAVRTGTDEPSSARTELLQAESQLGRSREALARELSTAEVRLSTAKDRYARAREPSPRLLEEIETLTVRRDALQQKASSTDARMDRLAEQKTTLERWRQVLRGEAERSELDAWKSRAEQNIRDLELAEVQKEGRAAELRERARAGRERLASLPADDPLHATLEARFTVLDDLASFYQADLEQMAAQRHLMERFVSAIDEQTGHVSLTEQAARVVGFLRSVWDYELAVVDDQGITTGEVVIAFALIVLGFITSRRVSRVFAASLHRRFRLDAGATAAIETLTFYLLLVAFVLLSLRTVNFPLTAFTILGGALAIGIGFGSQNIMNNFISGLILLLERPIRSGDLVALEESFGTVERIGARSTQIRATDNTHVIVPNSFFLENKVVNWTLSDDVIRAQVNVGVTYGSPTRKVEELLRRVLDENEKILRTPVPVIVFAEFGDNSLNFEAYFWVRARSPMAIRRIASEVRFRIDDLFREAGIVIAFPQRDVHLDAAAPLDVRVVAPPSGKEKE